MSRTLTLANEWGEAPAVLAALKTIDLIERLSDHLAGVGDVDDITGPLRDACHEIESALDTRRDESIAAAVKAAGFEPWNRHTTDEQEAAYLDCRDQAEADAPKVAELALRVRRDSDWSISTSAS
jgi:hypothetical protein